MRYGHPLFMFNIERMVLYLFEWTLWLLLISSPERRIPVNFQNSGCGHSKRTHAADNRSDEAMASQVEEMLCLDSIVRMHHVYKTVWTSWLGEILTVIPEPENNHDRHAVCVKKGREIVGHVPCELSRDGVALFYAWRTADL